MRTLQYLSIITLSLFSCIIQAQENIDLLILNKNYNEALIQIEKQIEQKPDASLFLKKGLVFNNLQNYPEAIAAYNEGLKIAPGDFDLNAELAETQAILGNYFDAVKYYQHAAALQPGNISLKGKLGKCLINLNQYKEAYKLFSEIYLSDSTNVYWNKQLAFCAYQTGRMEQSMFLYEKVIEHNPRDYKSYFNLLKLYGNKKKSEKIVSLIEKGLKQFPGDPDFYLELANFYYGNRQYDFAVPQFEGYFIAGGDSIFKVQLNYGICCYLSGQDQKAMNVLRNCYFINPNDVFTLFYMSLCNKKNANYEKAEELMQSAIDMSYPDWLPEMYHHLGQIYGQQRKFPESIEALKKSHELNPSNPEVLFEIATTFEEYNSNKTLALNYYRIYLKEAGEEGKNLSYALDRINRIKEDLFFEK